MQLYPIILPYFKKPNKAAFDSLTSILTFLRPPLTRSVYDIILDQFKIFYENNKQFAVEDFINVLPMNPTIDLESIDLNDATEWRKEKDLPFRVHDYCITRYNETHFLLTGGALNGKVSKRK